MKLVLLFGLAFVPFISSLPGWTSSEWGTTRFGTYSDAEWMASRCLEITKKVQIASYRLAADPTETASPKSVTAPSNRKQS